MERQVNVLSTAESHAHLSATKNQPLLGWRDTGLLFDFLFDTSDLGLRQCNVSCRRETIGRHNRCYGTGLDRQPVSGAFDIA